ncbi:fumarylacetoacetate hydrolase family protein [Halalkalibacter urbisdiaboli]|uniref:fumarylacetoacetate hydrolase family protein n=1 Tax=Halalkalibacter urbisdiaboli TaxID=1960589 RepID=UPI000B43939D|nr:fumarylacetoacetate hydrolase family protein [Halalkalibacter urbisdiaboli]
MEKVGNIFCIGRNYANHASELGNEIPKEPILFSKPTHALTYADGETICFPNGQGDIHHELEIVLYIDREVNRGDRVDDVVGKMALGLDLTLRDVQTALKDKGHPWLRAKGFKNSAIMTKLWDFPGEEACKKQTFSLTKNGVTVQKGNIQDMMFNFQAIIHECLDVFGLGEGDLIYTGTPEGVGPIADGDEFIFYWGGEEKGRFRVSK